MSFSDKPHNWNEKLVKDFTRGQIKSYYEKNINKIFPHLKNSKVLVILGIGHNQFVLKRNLKDKPITITEKYGIDNPHSFEYWINRRVIEFHPVIGKRTNKIWVDIDTHDGEELLPELAVQISKFFRKHFQAKTKIWTSGQTGIHVEGYLKEKIGTDRARREIREYLKTLETKKVTLGIAKKRPNSIGHYNFEK